jgi:hypothetical protein
LQGIYVGSLPYAYTVPEIHQREQLDGIIRKHVKPIDIKFEAFPNTDPHLSAAMPLIRRALIIFPK